jgi:hypothetical protein
MLRRSSLVECVSVLHGTCLQSVEFFFIRQYVQPCLSKNPKYISRPNKSRHFLMHWMSVKLPDYFQMCEHSWPCRFHIMRVECVSVLHGTCLQSVENVFIRQYVHPCLSKKYTFYTIKSSLTFAFFNSFLEFTRSVLIQNIFLTKYCCAVVLFRLLKVKHKIVVIALII